MSAVAARSRRPTVEELRAVVQPDDVMARRDEHWMGRAYMRRLSPYVTLALLRTPATPNAITGLMLVAGVAAGAVLGLPGLAAAVGATALMQLQLLLDCCDGELARWLERRSPAGVYVDHLAHWLTEAALPIGLGIHAAGGWGADGGWVTMGLAAAVLVLLVKGESALVHVTRAEAGLPPVPDGPAALPRGTRLRSLRRAVGAAPVYRLLHGNDLGLLVLLAAVADAIAGGLVGSRALMVAVLAAAVVTVAGHLVAILASSRLR